MRTPYQAKKVLEKRRRREPLSSLIFHVRDEAKKRKFPKTANILDAAIEVLSAEAETKGQYISMTVEK